MSRPLTAALRALANDLPSGELLLDLKTREAHSGDKWFASNLPDAVAIPTSTEAVSSVLRVANMYRIPVTPRGAGFGYVGGCVPAAGGIALSLAGLNRIKEINERDFVAVVEPGVVTRKLQEAAERKKLFYPPDPASRGDCHLGGNIATNAGGPRCLKYGVTRDYVLGLEVVLADGRVVRLGSRTHKNKTGFDLARWFVGSEGMLGVITEATLKLLPLPPFRSCLAVGFSRMADATRAIRNIFAAGFLPCALELADAFTLEAARKRTGSRELEGCRAHIIVELDGQKGSVRAEVAQIGTVLKRSRPLFVKAAHGGAACERLWQIRREFSYALRDTGLTKLNEDVVVPRSKLDDLFRFTARLQKRLGVPIACFGHAGDGNIHVNVMVAPQNPEAAAAGHKALDALFSQVLAWGGVITGEHGIGMAKSPWWSQAVSPEVHELHVQVKRCLDPNGILNPGKFI